MMGETYIGVPTLEYYLVWIIIFVGGAGLITCGCVYSYMYKESDVRITVAGVILGIILMMFGGLLNKILMIGMKWEPAYKIYIQGDESSTKTIRRIDPETDATNVCRAAKEFEAKAMALSNTESEMERIAATCK